MKIPIPEKGALQLPPNQYFGIPFDPTKLPDVRAAGHVSGSLLMSVLKDPALVFSKRKEETPSMQWGSLIDCLWLTPERFGSEYAVLPENPPRRPTDRQRNAAKPSQSTIDAVKFWDDWNATNGGKIVVDRETMAEAYQAVAMLDAHPVAKKMLSASKTQVVVVADKLSAGLEKPVKAKGMLDMLPNEDTEYEHCIIDLKTTKDVSEHGIRNAIATYGYHVKMRWYQYLVTNVTANYRPRLVLIFQLSKPPYTVKIRELVKQDLEIADGAINAALHKLEEIDSNDKETIMDTEVRPVQLPNWARVEAYTKGWGVDDDEEEDIPW